MKNEKGITLVAVVVTVIVLIILSGVVIAMLVGNNSIIDKAGEAKFSTQIATYYEEYNTFLLGKYVETLSSYDKELLNADNIKEENDGVIPISKVMPSMKEKYYLDRIKVKKGEWEYSNFTEKETEIIESIVNNKYQEGQKPDKPEDTDNKYKQTGVNKPMPPVEEDVWNDTSVETGVLPIVFDETGGYKTVTDLTKQWYSYEEQIGNTKNGGTSKWANVRTLDGSLWVWIPRYAYKITSGAHIKVDNNDINHLKDVTEAGKIEVKFLKDNTNEFYDGTTTETIIEDPSKITYTDTGTEIIQNEWFVSAAFKFNDKPLNGFWVAKYEASSLEGNGNKMSIDNVLGTKKVSILPGKESWRYIETKNMFGNCIFMGTADNKYYGLRDNTNTHLIKNDEWGTVAYLAHSKYGRNGTAISPNTSSKYITGTGGPLASTTGNYYGIFDMVGGASDGVAARHISDTEGIGHAGKPEDLKEYVNIYDKYEDGIKGDALYETSLKNHSARSWFKGLSWMIYKSEPRMSRGGMYQQYGAPKPNAGEEEPSIFSFYRYSVVDYHLKYISFRPTMITSN